MLGKSKYCCSCLDCNKSFFSEQRPFYKQKFFSNLWAFKKKMCDSTSVEAHSLCVSSASVEEGKLESSVQCPNCGGRNVILDAIAD